MSLESEREHRTDLSRAMIVVEVEAVVADVWHVLHILIGDSKVMPVSTTYACV